MDSCLHSGNSHCTALHCTAPVLLFKRVTSFWMDVLLCDSRAIGTVMCRRRLQTGSAKSVSTLVDQTFDCRTLPKTPAVRWPLLKVLAQHVCEPRQHSKMLEIHISPILESLHLKAMSVTTIGGHPLRRYNLKLNLFEKKQ